jgi:hypothetical protein
MLLRQASSTTKPPPIPLHGKSLFPQNFLHLADFLLDLPAYLFASAFAFQVGIVRQLAHLFFNRALHFVNLAGDLILSTWLHLVASSDEIEFQRPAKRPSASPRAKKALVPAPTGKSPAPAAEQKQNEQNDQYSFHCISPSQKKLGDSSAEEHLGSR